MNIGAFERLCNWIETPNLHGRAPLSSKRDVTFILAFDLGGCLTTTPPNPPPDLELCSLSTEKTRRERNLLGTVRWRPCLGRGGITRQQRSMRDPNVRVCVCVRECMLDRRGVHGYIRALRMATVPPLTSSRLKRRKAKAATRNTAAPPSAPTAPAPAATHASPAPGARTESDSKPPNAP